jgi:histidine triad (HIT) family protein
MANPEAEMQEKLKNMSPEELKQFQMQNCIFCHIVSGKVASKKVYEDDKCIALLDINPANPGHVLLLPKEHYAIMPLIPNDIIQHLFMVAKQISAALLKMLNKDMKDIGSNDIGTNIFVANGAAAGQKAQHFMIHIIPRMSKDNVGLDLVEKNISDSVLDSLQKMLAEKIAKDLGVKPIEITSQPKKEEDKFEENPDTGFLEPKKPDKDEKKAKKTKKTKKEKEESVDVSLDDISKLITG